MISGDTRILRNPHEREAWRESGLTIFVQAKSWTNHKFWDQACSLVRWWPPIVKQANLVVPGSAFEFRWKWDGKFKALP